VKSEVDPGAVDRSRNAALRKLPSVEDLARSAEGNSTHVAVRAARAVIAEAREGILAGRSVTADLEAEVRARAAKTFHSSYRRVINATGVIVHTNLGRAPLAAAARDAVEHAASGYSNLELDLEVGGRGSRQAHVQELAAELTGAEAALVVNNGAAAVLLASAALAGGRELIVSRGQLIEIGGSFRIPEIVSASGAALVEVGTTNRTRVDDYANAISSATGAILRAHPSNFRSLGFVEDVSVEDLCNLGVAVVDDLGSGLLVEDVAAADDEPTVRRSVLSGAAVVCFSGDKLLGGPQSGLMVGQADAIASCRAHPIARAVRIDKLSLSGLEATLRLYLDPTRALAEIPVLRMLEAAPEELLARAEALRSGIAADGYGAQIVEASAKVGGGALPLLELAGPVCAVDPSPVGLDRLVRRLRRAPTPVIGTARDGKLNLDPRTLENSEVGTVVAAVGAAFG